MNDIKKFSDFIVENLHDTPEQYVYSALTKIKTKLEKMFAYEKVENGEIKRFGEKDLNKEKGEMSFKDLGVELQSLEISKYSKQYDNVKLIFTDEKARYDVIVTIDLKDAVPQDKDKDFSDTDIEKCFFKFKKYDLDNFNLIGEITKTVKIKDINEELLINLKLELDEQFGESDEETLEIETE